MSKKIGLFFNKFNDFNIKITNTKKELHYSLLKITFSIGRLNLSKSGGCHIIFKKKHELCRDSSHEPGADYK